MIKRVVILGAGNVAFHLTRALIESTVNVRQVYNRTIEKAADIAIAHKIKFTDKISELEEADLYIISSADSAIEEISYHIPFENALVVHTSGSMPMSTLKGKYRKGVLYPLQTFSKSKHIEYDDIPFFIEAENKQDETNLIQMVKRVSSKAYVIDSDQRMKMHVAAVFANNFSNHMYAISEKLCNENDIPFNVMHALIRETTEKVIELSPEKSQTGPAERYDQIVIDKHLQLLTDDKLKSLYKNISKSIQDSLAND